MPFTSPEKPSQEPGGEPDALPYATENLALLYQGLITGIVRLKAGRQRIQDGETFRRRTKATLHEVERVAVAEGYDVRDIGDTHYAVVAFLDEVILHLHDPIKTEWEKRSLQEELFGKTDAGVVFFEKLDHFRARRDSPQLADILEVYLLCLQLGFEGRFSGARRGELDGIAESVRMRIEYIRGRDEQLSPYGLLPVPTQPAAAAPGPKNHLPLLTAAAAVFTFVWFWILWLNLRSISAAVRSWMF